MTCKKDRITTALQGLEQIREGVQESYDDVRELLVHFRTRVGNADLETAVRSALEKFEGQNRYLRRLFASRDGAESAALNMCSRPCTLCRSRFPTYASTPRQAALT